MSLAWGAVTATSFIAMWLAASVDGTATSAGRPDFVVAQFLSAPNPTPTHYRAIRRMRASNERHRLDGWLDAVTEYDVAGGFRYEILSEGGSARIRERALRAVLKAEAKAWLPGRQPLVDFTSENYDFGDPNFDGGGLVKLCLKPRRDDVALIDGQMFLSPENGDLVRVEGELAKNPSFWTRRVQLVRYYERIGGVRVPVRVESVADIRFAGPSRFVMTYEYETINGQPAQAFLQTRR